MSTPLVCPQDFSQHHHCFHVQGTGLWLAGYCCPFLCLVWSMLSVPLCTDCLLCSWVAVREAVATERPSETAIIDASGLQVAVTPDRKSGTVPKSLFLLAGPWEPTLWTEPRHVFKVRGGEHQLGAKYLRQEVKSITRSCKISLPDKIYRTSIAVLLFYWRLK